eukprot:scaffold6021_cov379-Prasinococcus_capsulatus_cf.AAC.5
MAQAAGGGRVIPKGDANHVHQQANVHRHHRQQHHGGSQHAHMQGTIAANLWKVGHELLSTGSRSAAPRHQGRLRGTNQQ